MHIHPRIYMHFFIHNTHKNVFPCLRVYLLMRTTAVMQCASDPLLSPLKASLISSLGHVINHHKSGCDSCWSLGLFTWCRIQCVSSAVHAQPWADQHVIHLVTLEASLSQKCSWTTKECSLFNGFEQNKRRSHAACVTSQ